jgi:hypothetical protein
VSDEHGDQCADKEGTISRGCHRVGEVNMARRPDCGPDGHDQGDAADDEPDQSAVGQPAVDQEQQRWPDQIELPLDGDQ